MPDGGFRKRRRRRRHIADTASIEYHTRRHGNDTYGNGDVARNRYYGQVSPIRDVGHGNPAREAGMEVLHDVGTKALYEIGYGNPT